MEIGLCLFHCPQPPGFCLGPSALMTPGRKGSFMMWYREAAEILQKARWDWKSSITGHGDGRWDSARQAPSAPCSIHSDCRIYVTAEVLVYLRYSRGHQLLCDVGIYKFHLKERRHHCSIVAVSIGPVTREDEAVCLLLWLLGRRGDSKLSAVLWLPGSPSSLWTQALPAPSSANSETQPDNQRPEQDQWDRRPQPDTSFFFY